MLKQNNAPILDDITYKKYFISYMDQLFNEKQDFVIKKLLELYNSQNYDKVAFNILKKLDNIHIEYLYQHSTLVSDYKFSTICLAILASRQYEDYKYTMYVAINRGCDKFISNIALLVNDKDYQILMKNFFNNLNKEDLLYLAKKVKNEEMFSFITSFLDRDSLRYLAEKLNSKNDYLASLSCFIMSANLGCKKSRSYVYRLCSVGTIALAVKLGNIIIEDINNGVKDFGIKKNLKNTNLAPTYEKLGSKNIKILIKAYINEIDLICTKIEKSNKKIIQLSSLPATEENIIQKLEITNMQKVHKEVYSDLSFKLGILYLKSNIPDNKEHAKNIFIKLLDLGKSEGVRYFKAVTGDDIAHNYYKDIINRRFRHNYAIQKSIMQNYRPILESIIEEPEIEKGRQ